MGYGSYSSSDWSKLKQSRNITDNSTLNDLYKATGIKREFDPKNFEFRESCDSPDNPNSTAIIFGLDVTGSMGYLSENIAKSSLNRTMVEIYQKKPVTDPHIMFNAIGDSKSDAAPLQATQFEADIRIVEQLLDIWFEGHGGGNGGESYLLTWYLAYKKTKIDCFDKRGKKGFIFTIGDECTHKDLYFRELMNVFGEKPSFLGLKNKNYTAKELYDLASERYEVFHICLMAGSYFNQKSGEDWKALIGNHAIELDPKYLDMLPQVFVSIMQLVNGMEIETILSQWDVNTQIVVGDILAGINKENEELVF